MINGEESNGVEYKPYGVYKVWCNGKIFVHPVRPWWWLLDMYIIVGLAVFIYEYNRFNFWVVVFGALLGTLSLLASLKTSLTDPGVWPKPPPQDCAENKQEVLRQISTGHRVPVRHVADSEYGRNIAFSYCYKCLNFRPPRCFHCNVCDCCVQEFDHHCPVFGGCIGCGNKCWFHLMVATVPTFWGFLLVTGGYSTLSNLPTDTDNDKAGKPNDVHSLTLYTVLIGFLGALVLPPLLSKFACIDKAHSRQRFRRTPSSNSHAFGSMAPPGSYPRQPNFPYPIPSVVAGSEKTEKPSSSHSLPAKDKEDSNLNIV